MSTHGIVAFVEFAEVLRGLREKSGLSIKRLAPSLGVDYTYLSKLESNRLKPSAELVERVSAYFNYDRDQLMLSADKIPADIKQILRDHPEDAIAFLRNRFGGNVDRPKP